jgi:putative transport protein
VGQKLVNQTAEVTRDDVVGIPAEELRKARGLEVLFGRVRHGEHTRIVTDETKLSLGDLITMVGTAPEVTKATAVLGS